MMATWLLTAGKASIGATQLGLGTAPLSGHRGLQLELASSNASHVNIFGRLGPPVVWGSLSCLVSSVKWRFNGFTSNPSGYIQLFWGIPLHYGTTMGILVKPVLSRWLTAAQ